MLTHEKDAGDKFTADVCCYGCYHAWFYPWRKDDTLVKIDNDPDISMVELSHSLAEIEMKDAIKKNHEQPSHIPYNTRKPVDMRFPKQWEHMTFRQTRENLIDKGSIYGPIVKQGLPRPGHRDVLTREAADIECKEERKFVRKITGYPLSAHISGSAKAKRSRSVRRRPTANTICQEYQYVHNGLRGKTILNSKKFRNDFREVACDHGEEDKAHYCEVLGRRTCADCIEHMNKEMAAKYQNDAFPSIQTTAASLVAPKLSKALTKSQRDKTRDLRSRQLSVSVMGDADSPVPYRMSSAPRESRRVTIYHDTMIDSLQRTLARDRRMTMANFKEMQIHRKPSRLLRKTTQPSGSLMNFLFNSNSLPNVSGSVT